jgi:DNA-binding NtrC family response regulator
MPRVLVVDDEAAVRESLRMLLKGECEVEVAHDVDSALLAISKSAPDLILLDVVMPRRSGLELLAELSERGIDRPVIVLTATNTISVAVQAMKLGAADFLTKPFELEALRIKVRQLLEHRRLADEVLRLREEVEDRQQLGRLVGRSRVMREIFRSIERVARARATVLVTGESGTGKELVARALHDLSERAAGPFVAINCGAIPRDLLESELFGHERGAFTGASDRRVGRFEAASGGTLLLDEIGELETSVQVKLLRALQERVIERLGSSQTIAVDVRVVAATNRDLEREVADGRFRSDLYYRINVVPLHLPPLRERREDVRLLAETFLVRAGEDATRLSAGARAALEDYSWPGNVRELENAIEHGLALCDGGTIEVEHLPLAVREAGRAEAVREDWRQGRLGFEEAVARFETAILREALERADWNQTRAARNLQITRRLLKLKMDRLGVVPPS